MVWLLLLTHPAALLYYYRLPRREAPRDAAEILRNGAADNLKRKFHRQRLFVRAGIVVGVALLASLPALAHSLGAYLLSTAGLAWVGGCYFAGMFNRLLNIVRHQSYVEEWYVSFATNSADWPDGYLARLARRHYPLPDETAHEVDDQILQQREAYASDLLRRLSRGLLVGGGVGYVGSVVYLVYNLG